jgi:hypothetical protein
VGSSFLNLTRKPRCCQFGGVQSEDRFCAMVVFKRLFW